MKKFLLLNIFSFAFLCVFAQTSLPIDTVVRGNLKVVLFEDKTWQYLDIPTTKEADIDTSSLFTDNWVTTAVYARRLDYARTKDTAIIDLLNHGGFKFPIKGKILSKFGMRSGRMHHGVDISLNKGDSVLAAFDGVVRFAGWNNSGYGNTVVIRHYNGLETAYAHLEQLKCAVNQKVKAGDLIGTGGSSGRASCTHLHFETRLQDNPFDPELIFNIQTGEIVAEQIPLYPKNFLYLKNVSNSDYHIVKAGDTLWGISKKYNVSVGKICSLNGISENSILSLGQRLRLR